VKKKAAMRTRVRSRMAGLVIVFATNHCALHAIIIYHTKIPQFPVGCNVASFTSWTALDPKVDMLVLALVCTAIIYAGALYSYLPKKLGRLAGNTQRKARKFDKILDDFMGKKFGAGEFFYGERSSALGKNASQTADRNAVLTPNAVLVVGSPDCAWIQWTIIELIEKGFTVRLLCASAFAAYQATSLPGISFDVVEARTEGSDGEIALAVQNVQAIIFGSMNKDIMLRIPFFKGPPIRERVLEIVMQAVSAKVLDVKKIVLLTIESDNTEHLQTQVVSARMQHLLPTLYKPDFSRADSAVGDRLCSVTSSWWDHAQVFVSALSLPCQTRL
jgi:hypothetical protein